MIFEDLGHLLFELPPRSWVRTSKDLTKSWLFVSTKILKDLGKSCPLDLAVYSEILMDLNIHFLIVHM